MGPREEFPPPSIRWGCCCQCRTSSTHRTQFSPAAAMSAKSFSVWGQPFKYTHNERLVMLLHLGSEVGAHPAISTIYTPTHACDRVYSSIAFGVVFWYGSYSAGTMNAGISSPPPLTLSHEPPAEVHAAHNVLAPRPFVGQLWRPALRLSRDLASVVALAQPTVNGLAGSYAHAPPNSFMYVNLTPRSVVTSLPVMPDPPRTTGEDGAGAAAVPPWPPEGLASDPAPGLASCPDFELLRDPSTPPTTAPAITSSASGTPIHTHFFRLFFCRGFHSCPGCWYPAAAMRLFWLSNWGSGFSPRVNCSCSRSKSSWGGYPESLSPPYAPSSSYWCQRAARTTHLVVAPVRVWETRHGRVGEREAESVRVCDKTRDLKIHY